MTGFPGAAGRTGPPGPSVSKSLPNMSSYTLAKRPGLWWETGKKLCKNMLLIFSCHFPSLKSVFLNQ